MSLFVIFATHFYMYVSLCVYVCVCGGGGGLGPPYACLYN